MAGSCDVAESCGDAAMTVCGSRSSYPAIASTISAASSIVRAKTPIVSRVSRLREHSTPGDEPAARLEAHYSTIRSGANDRAIRLRADSQRNHATRRPRRPIPRRNRPACGFGSCGLRVFPGVKAASSVVTVLPRMIAPALRRRLDDRRVVKRPSALVEDGAVLGRQIARVDDVLQADRHAMQRPGRSSGGSKAIGGLRLPHGVFGIEVLPGLHLRARARRCVQGTLPPARRPSPRRARFHRAPERAERSARSVRRDGHRSSGRRPGWAASR